jgi:hypothetical protein
MAGVDPEVRIPSVNISRSNPDLVVSQLQADERVNVTLRTKSDKPTEDSVRWLLGEDATNNPILLNGRAASRDLWDPTCLSNPGKVSDAEYTCAASDQGGIHTNSGVPAHGFALLTDGGAYNGYTVRGLGLAKAAHIYWRAQSVYQTPATDFSDHADALVRSCVDLIGRPLRGLSTGAPAGVTAPINALDCLSVLQMTLAVELRKQPMTQCDFAPLLEPGLPAICEQRKPRIVYEARRPSTAA